MKAFLFKFHIMKKIVFTLVCLISFFTVATSAIDIYSENQLPSSSINNFDNAEYNDLFDLVNSFQVARYLSPSFSVEATATFNNLLASSSRGADSHFTFDTGVLVSLKGLKSLEINLRDLIQPLKQVCLTPI